MLRMEVLIWKKRSYHNTLALAALICAVCFRGVTCEEEAATQKPHTVLTAAAYNVLAFVRGDDVHPTASQKTPGTNKDQDQVLIFPDPSEMTSDMTTLHTQTTPRHCNTNTPAAEASHEGDVRCVKKVQGTQAVRLKLKAVSSCEENRIKIQSVQEHLCQELEIFQEANTDEMIISGPCIQADVKGMRDKFNNDNIKDKVDIEEVELISMKHSRAVLVSVLLTGLLLAALLIAGYLLTTHRRQAKGMRLAEDSFQVDDHNQGNTLLSVAPLPSQEPLDKPTSNGESPESPPTNGHSTSQTPVADTQM